MVGKRSLLASPEPICVCPARSTAILHWHEPYKKPRPPEQEHVGLNETFLFQFPWANERPWVRPFMRSAVQFPHMPVFVPFLPVPARQRPIHAWISSFQILYTPSVCMFLELDVLPTDLWIGTISGSHGSASFFVREQ